MLWLTFWVGVVVGAFTMLYWCTPDHSTPDDLVHTGYGPPPGLGEHLDERG